MLKNCNFSNAPILLQIARKTKYEQSNDYVLQLSLHFFFFFLNLHDLKEFFLLWNEFFLFETDFKPFWYLKRIAAKIIIIKIQIIFDWQTVLSISRLIGELFFHLKNAIFELLKETKIAVLVFIWVLWRSNFIWLNNLFVYVLRVRIGQIWAEISSDKIFKTLVIPLTFHLAKKHSNEGKLLLF